MKGIVRFCKGLAGDRILRRLLVSAALAFLCLIGFCGIARPAVIGCPDKPITLADAQHLSIRFDETGDTPQVCSFSIKDFVLQNHGNIIFNNEAGAESDRFVFKNEKVGGINRAMFCFASDPDLYNCIKDSSEDKSRLADQIEIEDSVAGLTIFALLSGEGIDGLLVSINSDGDSSGEKRSFCSDRLSFFEGLKAPSAQSDECTSCQQCATPEPGTLALLGLGIAGMAFMSRRLRQTPFTP